MMNAMFMLLNSIESRGRFARTLESLRQNSPKEVEFSHESYPFHLDDDDCIRLGEAVSHSTHLQKLHLDVTNMTTAGTRTLIPAISSLSRLRTLRMEGDIGTQCAKRLTATITNQLIAAARQNPCIQALQLSKTHFHSPCVADYCATSVTLTELLLCDVWHDATPAMVKRLAKGIGQSSSLRTLTLVSVGDDVAVPLLEDGAKHMAQLSTLHLSLPRFSAAVAKAVRSVLDEGSYTLQRLHFWGIRNLDVQNWSPVVQGLVHSESVYDVVFGACEFSDAGIQLLCSELLRNSKAKLNSLNLTQSIDRIEHWTAICTALHRNTTLHVLDLCNNPTVDASGAANAVDNMLRRNKHLCQLDIDRNPEVEICSYSFQNNHSLLHLDVSGTELGDAGFRRLCVVFETNTTLRRLFVCGNELTSLATLVDALIYNPNCALTHLYAHGNQFGDAGGHHLALVPPTSALRSLYLDHVGMGAAGVAALLAHPSFTVLSLRELDLRNDTSAAMEQALATMSPQYQHVSMTILAGPDGNESDDETDEDADEERISSGRNTPSVHYRTRLLNKTLLERGLHLKSIALTSLWFRLDPHVVQFVLERNQSRTAVTETRSLLPHALANVHLSAAFFLLRRDPAAFSTGAAVAAAAAVAPRSRAIDAETVTAMKRDTDLVDVNAASKRPSRSCRRVSKRQRTQR